MTQISSITLEAADPAAARHFYDTAFGLDDRLRVREAVTPSTGFRGFTLSLIVAQPANATALFDAAVGAGAAVRRPLAKSMWGFGGVVQAPDGAIWKLATSKKKDSARASREVEDVVLLLGCADVKASKRFYAEHGLEVGKSFGGKYVEFAAAPGTVKLALYKHAALAKDAGIDAAGSGSHRLTIESEQAFSDPDGFFWEPAADRAAA